MFLRSTQRKKNDRIHRYFSVVENRRLPGFRTVQRTVLYLGEINDQQQAAWRKTLEVFDEDEQDFRTLSLFPDDREVPADVLDSIQVKLSGLELRRPRTFGACWLGCELWQQLGLDEFWRQRLPEAREAVSWEKVLQLQVVNCLLDPGSDFRLHRQWYVDTAMDELLETDFAVAAKDRLYRCLDRVLPYKQELFVWLKQKWSDLFHSDFEVLLYDLTSTYFEGEMEQNPKAKRGYSRDKRPDCLQLVIALVVTTDGLPLAYEVMKGNTSDRTTLPGFLKKIEDTYGKARRVWVMDRGVPSEAILKDMRSPERQTFYLVGTPKSKINQHEKKWLDLPWQKVRDSVDVKLYEHEGELYVLARSGGRQAKENAMRRKRLARLLRKLRAMRKSLPKRDQLLLRIGAARKEAGRAFGFVKIQMPAAGQAVTRETFSFQVDKAKLKATEQRDGHYLLRSNLTGEDPAVLWTRYVQLTQIESVFRSLKSELSIRPIGHQLEHRADAHVLVAFLAYSLQVTLKNRLMKHAPGLTPAAVFEKLATIQMVEVWIPMVDGRWLVMPRHTQPEPDVQALLNQTRITLPSQPPPRIKASQIPPK
ncbi:MAG TPA: IS1634 family transposase [Candidatus Limnocylindrales bacterium]|jgi:transposase|nr:IS1634 family transposase [Candidatus Limnocylindrales bacterium]